MHTRDGRHSGRWAPAPVGVTGATGPTRGTPTCTQGAVAGEGARCGCKARQPPASKRPPSPTYDKWLMLVSMAASVACGACVCDALRTRLLRQPGGDRGGAPPACRVGCRGVVVRLVVSEHPRLGIGRSTGRQVCVRCVRVCVAAVTQALPRIQSVPSAGVSRCRSGFGGSKVMIRPLPAAAPAIITSTTPHPRACPHPLSLTLPAACQPRQTRPTPPPAGARAAAAVAAMSRGGQVRVYDERKVAELLRVDDGVPRFSAATLGGSPSGR